MQPATSAPPRRRGLLIAGIAGAAAVIVAGTATAILLTSGDGRKPTAAAQTSTPTPSATATTPTAAPPTTSATPGDLTLKLGQPATLGGVTVTVYGYKRIKSEVSPHGFGAVDARTCNVSGKPIKVSQAPWSLLFADDTVAEAGISGLVEPEYPFDGRRLTPGRCVRGWVPAELPGASRPIAVEYAPELPGAQLPTATWTL